MSLLVLKAIKPGGLSLGVLYFICLVLWDNWIALRSKPRTWWIPGKALILSALSIQVLSYLVYRNNSISGGPDKYSLSEGATSEQKKDITMLLGHESLEDSGRLLICVFIGYLLPGMATRGSARSSGNIVALVVTLFTVITSEILYVQKAEDGLPKPSYYSEDNKHRKVKRRGIHREEYDVYHIYVDPKYYHRIKLWFILSSAFLVAIVLLNLFLVSAVLAGKTVRCMLKQRINSAGSFNKPHRAECWEKFDDEVLKSWLLCRASQPQYVIARSVLSSSTGLVVTFCIVLMAAKTLMLGSSTAYFYDGLDELRKITLVLQCIFVLLGGWVVLQRWFLAVIHFPIFCGKGVKSCLSTPRWFVEDFWTRSIFELINMYDLQQWRTGQKAKADKSGIFNTVLTAFKLHKLLYCLLPVQMLLVWFSKCCRLFSEIIFGSRFIRRAVLGNDERLFYDVDPSEDYQEYKKYKEALEHVCMPGENPASLWLTNKDSISQAKDRIKIGKESECQDLISLIKERNDRHDVERFLDQLDCLPLVTEYFPTLNEKCWKMTAISLLRIIIKVDVNGSKKALSAYRQAWDLMSVVESSNTEQPDSIIVTQVFDIEADHICIAADQEFKKLEKLHDKSPVSSREFTIDDAGKSIKEELEAAERLLKGQKLWVTEGEETRHDVEKADGHIYHGVHDSKDWSMIVPSYSMYRVCKKINSRSHRNIEELVDDLHICLGDVIANCLEQLPNILVSSFEEWTVEHQDDKMWEALYIAGKSKQVMHECELKPNWMTPQQKMSPSIEGQNN